MDERVPGGALSRAVAEAALRAACELAAESGLRVSVCVVDHLGLDAALVRGDGATWFTPEVARAKARTAAAFGRPTASLASMRDEYPDLFALVGTSLAWVPTVLPGGVPLLVDGHLLGAVGVSGAHPDDDVRAAEHAVAAARRAVSG